MDTRVPAYVPLTMHIWVCRCNRIYVKDLSYIGFKGDGSMKNHGIHKDSMNEK